MFIHPKKATLFTIIALTLIGLLSYTIKSSVTALIPVFFAVLMGICYFLYDNNNKLYLIDEIHTPDSSRYFYIDGYKEAVDSGMPPRQLSKEFFRQWLINNNFQGKQDQELPEITDISEDDLLSKVV